MIWFLPALDKRCLSEDGRNPDSNGRGIYKVKHGYCVPPRLCPDPPSIYTKAKGQAAGGDRIGAGGWRGGVEGVGRFCYTCQGQWLGQAAGGFCSKSDRLTSLSPLHEADIMLANHV